MYKNGSEWLWVLTRFQVFHSHSIQDCNTEEKQDSVTHNIYSQQGGARSTAGLAAGCGKKPREEKLQHKMGRPDCTNTPSPPLPSPPRARSHTLQLPARDT